MRVISADALVMKQVSDGVYIVDAEAIRNAPTFDAVPVVHGEWEWNDNGMDWGIGCWKCSNCHHKPEANWETARNINPNTWNGSHYCPNCGAKMDGGILNDRI